MKRLITASVCVLASMLLTPQAHAQFEGPLCPELNSSGQAISPLQLLVGRWRFGWLGIPTPNNAGPVYSAGSFTASVVTDQAGNQKGVLTITASTNLNGQITRQDVGQGVYQIFPDCSGGTLTFNLSSGPTSWEFWIDYTGEFRGVSVGSSVTALITISPDRCNVCILRHLTVDSANYCGAVALCQAPGVMACPVPFPGCP
jgi:hypothetical protein